MIGLMRVNDHHLRNSLWQDTAVNTCACVSARRALMAISGHSPNKNPASRRGFVSRVCASAYAGMRDSSSVGSRST